MSRMKSFLKLFSFALAENAATTEPDGALFYSLTTDRPMIARGGIGKGLAYASEVSGSIVNEYEIDFGTKPRRAGKFVVTGTTAIPPSKVIVLQSGGPAIGRTYGDSEWDSISYTAVCLSPGDVTVYANASGRVVGKRNIYIQIF